MEEEASGLSLMTKRCSSLRISIENYMNVLKKSLSRFRRNYRRNKMSIMKIEPYFISYIIIIKLASLTEK